MNLIKTKHKKVLAGFLCALLIITSGSLMTMPQQAEATIPVIDIEALLKEFVLDVVVALLVQQVISHMIQQVTDWAKRGFNGPVFSTNWKQYFKNIEGDIIEFALTEIEYFDGSTDIGEFFCGPFGDELKEAFRLQIAFVRADKKKEHSRCTIDHFKQEVNKLNNEFTSESWPIWINLVNSGNDRYSSYLAFQRDFWKQRDNRQTQEREQLQWGQGFFSKVFDGECTFVGPPPPGAPPNWCPEEYKTPSLIQTPGKALESKVNSMLNLPEGRIQVADEFAEMLSTILMSLALELINSDGGLAFYGQVPPESADPRNIFEKEGEKFGNAQTSEVAPQQASSAENAGQAEQQYQEDMGKLNQISEGELRIIQELQTQNGKLDAIRDEIRRLDRI